MGNLSCIYTVTLTPRTDKSSLEVVVFENPDKEDDIKKVFNFFRRNHVSPEPDVIPTKVIMFKGADTDTSYTLKVSLILNGQAIAVAQKSLKALRDPATQAILDAQNTALAAQLSTTVNASLATSLNAIDWPASACLYHLGFLIALNLEIYMVHLLSLPCALSKKLDKSMDWG